jgi:hypothetical protein
LKGQKKIFFFLLIFINNVCYSQIVGSKAHVLAKQITLPFPKSGFLIPPESILTLNFELKNNAAIANNFVIDLGREQQVQLFEIQGNRQLLIGNAGLRLPIMQRSIRADFGAILLALKPHETKSLILKISNFLPTSRQIIPKLLPEVKYQLQFAKKRQNGIYKYWVPGFFILLIIVLIFTIIQYYILPERHFIYYFLYLFFLLLRSASADERIVLEEISPWINKLGYSSTNSQLFVYISFIFYLLFLNSFTGLQVKKPKLFILYKIEIVYLLIFVIFDLLFPIQKYTDPFIQTIFRGMESFGVLIGLVNIIILLKMYDNFNKYIIVGAFSLFLVAIVGQEIIKRTIDENKDPNQYMYALTMAWSIAYIIELIFFTIALVSRQRQLLLSIENDKQKDAIAKNSSLENTKLTPIVNSETNEKADFEYFTLATNKGVFVYQQTEIIRLEASGNYTIFSINHNKQTLASYTLSEFEPKLNPSTFLRVHKSHMVNLQFVTKYVKGDGGVLTLTDGSEIPVSRSRKEELLKRLNTV